MVLSNCFLLQNVLSPEGRCGAYPVGVQFSLFSFVEFLVREGILDFKTYLLERPCFCFKMFYLTDRTGGTGGRSSKVFFNFFVLRYIKHSKHNSWRGHFEPWNCFIPRREMRSISSRGPIDTFFIYWLSERISDFQNLSLGEAFLKPLKSFISRREMRSISSRGPIETLSIYWILF